MTELTVTLFRLGFLALLWAFVFFTLSVLRRDLYGTRIASRKRVQHLAKSGRGSRRGSPDASGASPGVAGGQGAGGEIPRGRGAQPLAASGKETPLPHRLDSRPRQLVVTEGPLAGTALPLSNSGVLIGRSPSCTLVLDDDYSSSRHARIFPAGEEWVLEDLGSTNGTFIGNAKITQPTPIAAGVPVKIGQTTLELRR